MTVIAFDPAAFRLLFPEFGNKVCNPDVQLQLWFDLAASFIDTDDSPCLMLAGTARVQALNLMTAHIGKLLEKNTDGEQGGFVTSATIDKVSVDVQPPPEKSQYAWWLNQTAYGSLLAALLSAVTVGGTFVGGRPERAAFRRVGGGFG